MFFTQIVRRSVLVAVVFSAPMLAADHNDTPPALDPVVTIPLKTSEAVVTVEPAQGRTSMAAKIAKAAVQLGISTAGIVAIIDALCNRSGAAMATQAGLGVLALVVAALMSESREGASSCDVDDDYCDDSYHYNHGSYNDPIVFHHYDAQQPAVTYNHQHVEIIQPVVVQNSVAVQTDPITVQPVTQGVNRDNVELNAFWSDPFNY